MNRKAQAGSIGMQKLVVIIISILVFIGILVFFILKLKKQLP